MRRRKEPLVPLGQVSVKARLREGEILRFRMLIINRLCVEETFF